MPSSCVECVVSALCVEKGGPAGLGLYQCADCSGYSIATANRNTNEPGASLIMRPLTHLSCNRKFIIYRDKTGTPKYIECPHCKKGGTVGVLSFV